MKHLEKVTPVAAMLTAVTTLACCLPVTFAAAAATASLGAIAAGYRSWLIGLSGVLLVVAVFQIRSARACGQRSTASLVILFGSVAVVLLVVLFPQVLAGMLADWAS
jgi:hypothetical protein